MARRIAILSCTADAELKDWVSKIAREDGHIIVANAPTVAAAPTAPTASSTSSIDTCLVIMTRNAVCDQAFIETANIAALSTSTFIPVKFDDVAPEETGASGSPIRERNWADLIQLEPNARADALRRLLKTDVAHYDNFNELLSESARWEAANFNTCFLLQDKKAATAAQATLNAMEDDAFFHPNDTTRLFVKASQEYANTSTSKRRFRNIRTVACIVVAIVCAVAVSFLVAQYSDLAMSLARQAGLDTSNNAALSTLKTFDSVEFEENVSDATVLALYSGMCENWNIARLGLADTEQEGWQGEGRFINGEAQYLVRAPNGTVQIWDTFTAEPISTKRVSDDEWFVLDVADEVGVLAIASARGIGIFDMTDWSESYIETDVDNATQLALSSDATTCLIATNSEVRAYNLEEERELGSYAFDSVLDIASTDAGLYALAVDNGQLVIFGIDMGDVAAAIAEPDCATIVGTIDPEGDAVICCDGVLYEFSAKTSELLPLGFTTRDVPLDIVATEELLIIATYPDGVQVIDRESTAVLGNVACEMTGAAYVTLSGNGLIACGNWWYTSIWSLDPIVPAMHAPEAVQISTALEAEADDLHVSTDGTKVLWKSNEASTESASEEGAPEESTSDESEILEASSISGEVEAPNGEVILVVAACGDTFAFGTDAGTVYVYAPLSNNSAACLQTWQAPTGDVIEALGWTDDAMRLVVQAGGRWWSPYSCTAAIHNEKDFLLARMPAAWYESELEMFSDEFVEAMGMEQAKLALEAE